MYTAKFQGSDSTPSQSAGTAGIHAQQLHCDGSPAPLVVPAACVACRSKHLKCDGLKPCSRCSAQLVECSYVKSRRGYKGPRRHAKSTASARASAVLPADSGPSTCPLGADEAALVNLPPVPSVTFAHMVPVTSDHHQHAVDSASIDLSLRRCCLEAYFHYFQPSHPFLLPKQHLLRTLGSTPLPHLEAAIRYVGSYGVPQASTAVLEREAMELLRSGGYARDGFAVQAMLLMVLGLDGSFQQSRALDMLGRAQELALEIGMDQQGFAASNSDSLLVLEESWRRTWWELYVVDGMIAGVHQKSVFRLSGLGQDVFLPCEEQEYSSAQIPTARTLQEYDDSSFESPPLVFSSFAYRVIAMRIMGMILALPPHLFPDSPQLKSTDTVITTFLLSLPSSKALSITSDGGVDELMFQTFMIIYGCQIMLHRNHSQLSTTVTHPINSCAPARDVYTSSSKAHYNIHAAKIVKAAEDVCALIRLPVELTMHTHFFTCVITLSAIVQLSVWANMAPSFEKHAAPGLPTGISAEESDLRKQLELCTGGLRRMAEVWKGAEMVLEQVRSVARQVAGERKRAVEMGWWGAFPGLQHLEETLVIDGQGSEAHGVAERLVSDWSEEELGRWIVGEEVVDGFDFQPQLS